MEFIRTFDCELASLRPFNGGASLVLALSSIDSSGKRPGGQRSAWILDHNFAIASYWA